MTSPRQLLSKRQSETVAALLDAGLQELREAGWEQLSLRSVAQRAGVTHTTAYSYFASKAHLVAEVYYQTLCAVPDPSVRSSDRFALRVRKAFEGPSHAMAQEPELARAVLGAIIDNDADIRRLRDAAGSELARRLDLALGDLGGADVRSSLLFAYSGAMLNAGLGDGDYERVVAQLEVLGRLIEPSKS